MHLSKRKTSLTMKSVILFIFRSFYNFKSKCKRGFSLTDFPDILDDSLKPMKVVAIVTGCTVGVILVLTIIYFIRQRPKRNGSSPGKTPFTDFILIQNTFQNKIF